MPEPAWRGMLDRKPSQGRTKNKRQRTSANILIMFSVLVRRSTALIIQDRDGSLIKEPRKPRHPQPVSQSYRVEFPAALLDEQNSLIERIISFAFDTLGARRVDVRVREAE
jgi:hypothetical protein